MQVLREEVRALHSNDLKQVNPDVHVGVGRRE